MYWILLLFLFLVGKLWRICQQDHCGIGRWHVSGHFEDDVVCVVDFESGTDVLWLHRGQ
jgi:hypothetical protein